MEQRAELRMLRTQLSDAQGQVQHAGKEQQKREEADQVRGILLPGGCAVNWLQSSLGAGLTGGRAPRPPSHRPPPPSPRMPSRL